MAGERRVAKNFYGLMFLLGGVALSLILSSLLRTTIVSDKMDLEKSEVNSLFCTFERVQFDAEDVISIATGEKVTRINITVGTEVFQYYTYDASRLEFIDIGSLHCEYGQVLAFYSARLEDDIKYVVDYGTIIYFNRYGVPNERTAVVKIYEIHQRNSFDDFVSNASMEISILIGFGLVLTCSLFCLPLMEYHINHEIEERTTKKRKRNRKKAISIT